MATALAAAMSTGITLPVGARAAALVCQGDGCFHVGLLRRIAPSVDKPIPPKPSATAGSRETASASRVFLRLERQVLHTLRRIRNLPDVRPGLLVVRQDQLVSAGIDDVALHAGREAEQHEGLALSRGRRRIDHRLRRAALVVDLNEIAILRRRVPPCRRDSSR